MKKIVNEEGDMMENIGSVIITVLISSLAASIVTLIVNAHREKRKMKVELLMNIVGKMNQCTLEYQGKKDIPEYLNRVYIAYNDSEEVIKAIEDLKHNLKTDSTMDYFIKLIKAMCDNTHLKYDKLNDTFISVPFS